MMPATAQLVSSRWQGVEAALRRAALEARKLAERTQTPCYVIRDGRIVDLCQEKRQSGERP